MGEPVDNGAAFTVGSKWSAQNKEITFRNDVMARYVGIIPVEWGRYPVFTSAIIVQQESLSSTMNFVGHGCCKYRFTQLLVEEILVSNENTCVFLCQMASKCVAVDSQPRKEKVACRLHNSA